jgi:hypothetical protein
MDGIGQQALLSHPTPKRPPTGWFRADSSHGRARAARTRDHSVLSPFDRRLSWSRRLWVRGCSRHSRGADDKASPGTRATPAREGPKTGHHVMAGPEHTAARPRHGLLTVLQVKHLDRHHAHQRRSGQPTAGSTVNACTKLAPSLPAKQGPGPDPRPDPGQSASKPAVWPGLAYLPVGRYKSCRLVAATTQNMHPALAAEPWPGCPAGSGASLQPAIRDPAANSQTYRDGQSGYLQVDSGSSPGSSPIIVTGSLWCHAFRAAPGMRPDAPGRTSPWCPPGRLAKLPRDRPAAQAPHPEKRSRP